MNGLIPANHLDILNSSKRKKSGWVDESIRKLYIRAATTLAFRKMELKGSTGSSRQFYEKDVEYYRTFIQNLLAQSQTEIRYEIEFLQFILFTNSAKFNKEFIPDSESFTRMIFCYYILISF